MTLSRWESMSNPASVREAANHLFDHAVWWPMRNEPTTLSTPMNVYTDGDGYGIEVDLPGVNPEDIDMQLTGTTLTISGEFKSATPEGRRYLVCQRQVGMFQTTVTLPAAADSTQIKATFEHGLLRLEVPKSEAAKPKQIALQTST
jgi:HSP20 family protein